MKIEIPLTPEQEESLLLKMIESGTLFIDITHQSLTVPITVIDLLYRKESGMESVVRKAIPQDVPAIREFYECIRLIEEGIAK